jgi:Fe2+ or Zn2+ uptake regulation protein
MPDDFAGLLHKLNLKATPQRLAILDIMRQEKIFLAPDEIHELLRHRCSGVGLPTIYRNLEELAHKGVLTKILHPNRQLYYYFCPNTHHHHHFICLDCRAVADIDHCGFAEMVHHVDGEVFSHIAQLLGRCRSCLHREQGVPR